MLLGIAAERVAAGTLRSTRDELPFAERLIAIAAESGAGFAQAFDISLPQKDIRVDTPMHLERVGVPHHHEPEAARRRRGADRARDRVEPGPARADQAARSMPAAERRQSYLTGKVSWHQDVGVLREDADEATILSCWLAVTDATVENGCLEVIPGSHRGELAGSCPTGHDLGIPDTAPDARARRRPLPLLAGSALLLRPTARPRLPSTTRQSDEIRISMDLRFQPPGQPSGRPDFPPSSPAVPGGPDDVLHGRERVAAALGQIRNGASQGAELPAFNRWDADSPACA